MKINKEKIYHKLPVWMQNLAVSLFGYYWYIRRYGGKYKEELGLCKQRQYFSFEQWKYWQELELQKLLVHAFQTVPYYTHLFSKMGLDLDKLKKIKLEELPNIPILEKKTFRTLCATEILSLTQEPKGTFLYTSGSSGTPLKIRYSRRMHQKYFAIYESNVRNWAGVNANMSRGVIGGRRILKDGNSKGPFYRYNFVEKQLYFSAYHISKLTARNYLDAINKFKTDYLEGYASSLYFLARSIEESGLSSPQLKAILTSTDKLTHEMRETFRRVFKCEAYDSYNGVDLCNMISECEHHRLHIVPDVGIVEILNDEGQPCKPGEVGELVSTGLLNYDQPLIRYRIGDLVKLSIQQNCPCGRNMVIVDEIVGRVEDIVVGPDGRKMRRFNRIFIDIQSVIEGQVIQHELTKFEIKLVVSSQPEQEYLDIIHQRMKSQLGNIELVINIVDSIDRGPNGKFKAVISKVKR